MLAEPATAVDFRLLTPAGETIAPWVRDEDPTIGFQLAPRVAFYRFALPVERRPGRLSQAGTWHAQLRIGSPQLKRPGEPSSPAAHGQNVPAGWVARRNALVNAQAAVSHGAVTPGRTVPFALLVHAYSHIGLRARLHQRGHEPGARIEIEAGLWDSGALPVAARIWVEVIAPDGRRFELELEPLGQGDHGAAFDTRAPGVYRCRVRAEARDRLGYRFTREHTLTAAVWCGGDREAANPRDSSGEHAQPAAALVCELLACLRAAVGGDDELDRRLRAAGLDTARFRKVH